MMRSKPAVILMVGAVVLSGLVYFLGFQFPFEDPPLQLAPAQVADAANQSHDPRFQVGTGWSISSDPSVAANEAIEMALKGSAPHSTDFAVILDSEGLDFEQVVSEARRIFGSRTKFYGGWTGSKMGILDQGVIGQATEGSDKKRSLSILTLSTDEITFGVGSATYEDSAEARSAAAIAVAQAIENAGKHANELPQAILLTPSFGGEEEVLRGIESVVGTNTPLLGGTAFWSLSGNSREDIIVKKKGVSLAVIYTELPIGWAYEAGFEVKDPYSGTITRLEGKRILEIDNRSALDVYDEWNSGRVKELCLEGDRKAIQRFRNMNPLCKRLDADDKKVYYQFTITRPELETNSLGIAIEVEEGERLYLSRGSWETLLNRLGNLPRKARSHAAMGFENEVVFGVGYFCGGVVDGIPTEEVDRIPSLVQAANQGAPFIASITAGEQGHYPGIGNRHGHLSTSFLVIGK